MISVEQHREHSKLILLAEISFTFSLFISIPAMMQGPGSGEIFFFALK
jgi:hypothetical protein